jgi:hypothetical protein
MKNVIKSVTEANSLQPKIYAVSMNPEFIENNKHKAIKEIKLESRQYSEKGGAENVYMGYNHLDEAMFEVKAANVNVHYFSEVELKSLAECKG